MQDIYFLNYNNYYNRQVKNDGDDLSAYEPYIIDSLLNTNFNPNDGITTTHITGSWDYNHAPDYLLVFEAGTNFPPISRWFVIESVRTRMGQYQLSLVRDIISENYNSVLNSPCYIEKGWVPNTDSAIFNSEGVLVNQIKKNETPLYDPTGIPWVVGYIAPDYAEDKPITASASTEADYIFATTAAFPGYNKLSEGNIWANAQNRFISRTLTTYNTIDNLIYLGGDWNIGNSSNDFYLQRSFTTSAPDQVPSLSVDLDYITIRTGTFKTGEIVNADKDNFAAFGRDIWTFQKMNEALPAGYLNYDDFQLMQSLNGKKVYIEETGTLYNFSMNFRYSQEQEVILSNTSQLYRDTVNFLNTTNCFNARYNQNLGSIKAEAVYSNYTYTLTPITTSQYIGKISSGRNRLEDAPYTMFAMPYGDFKFRYNNVDYTISKDASMTIANSIAADFGGGASPFCYDIQLLPYSPITALSKAGDTYLLTTKIENRDYNIFRPSASGDDPTVNGIIFWATKSSFTFNINNPIEIDDYKITNECDMWRLCSPNYNGVFEFNAAKNGGVQFFNVDCTYKPYSPYIHINPNFGNLYGEDWDDARGLICGGDFSLAIVTDAWKTYQLQNKNYEKTFQRQIENMEIQHEVAKTQDAINLITGTLQGSTSGAATGAMAGGPAGAIAGGVVGGVSSLAGGIADVNINQMLRDEAKSYATDLYNYNLDNIRALPDSLARVSSFAFNNKIVPFLEYYSCTNEEKEAIRNKIKYNGMTIMRIGLIKDYLKEGEETYMKAKLIRWISDDAEKCDDFHHINFIAAELNKGVFITK